MSGVPHDVRRPGASAEALYLAFVPGHHRYKLTSYLIFLNWVETAPIMRRHFIMENNTLLAKLLSQLQQHSDNTY